MDLDPLATSTLFKKDISHSLGQGFINSSATSCDFFPWGVFLQTVRTQIRPHWGPDLDSNCF